MHPLAALITLLNVLLLFLTAGLVGRARGKYGIQAPATTGRPDFERTFRAQMNTLEQTVAFLPVLWLASAYSDEKIAAYLGFAWIVGRCWYVFGYITEADKRSMGFLIGFLAFLGLLGMSAWGLAHALFV